LADVGEHFLRTILQLRDPLCAFFIQNATIHFTNIAIIFTYVGEYSAITWLGKEKRAGPTEPRPFAL
jgi:hypothetical protein